MKVTGVRLRLQFWRLPPAWPAELPYGFSGAREQYLEVQELAWLSQPRPPV